MGNLISSKIVMVMEIYAMWKTIFQFLILHRFTMMSNALTSIVGRDIE